MCYTDKYYIQVVYLRRLVVRPEKIKQQSIYFLKNSKGYTRKLKGQCGTHTLRERHVRLLLLMALGYCPSFTGPARSQEPLFTAADIRFRREMCYGGHSCHRLGEPVLASLRNRTGYCCFLRCQAPLCRKAVDAAMYGAVSQMSLCLSSLSEH